MGINVKQDHSLVHVRSWNGFQGMLPASSMFSSQTINICALSELTIGYVLGNSCPNGEDVMVAPMHANYIPERRQHSSAH